jgi:hypothetical protein
MEEVMGTLFKYIDDHKILNDLFPHDCRITPCKDDDIYGDGKQAGIAYYLYDETYLLVPVHSKHTVKTIAGDRERDCIAWDVHVTIHIPSCDRMQPDDYDEKELILDTSFEDAIMAIKQDMNRCEIDNVMENYYYENAHKEDILNRENY